MNAEIITIGTEILLGDILNTNCQYLSKRLSELGVFVYKQTTIGDNPDRIKSAFREAFNNVKLVITTGGLGPTEDDLSKEMAAEFFGMSLELHKESAEHIENFFKRINRPMTNNNLKQAYFPADSIVLKNNKGTAPGCILEKDDCFIICLPGPPFEMTAMFESEVVPFLQKKTSTILVSKTLKVISLGESSMESMVIDLIKNQTNPTIAPYASFGESSLRITANADSVDNAEKLIAPVKKEIYNRLGNNIYGEDNETIESATAKLLLSLNLKIAVAESCTGGLISSRLINFPGISKSFIFGAVTYSNESKISELGVEKDTIDNYGAVSKETAEQMAIGIRNKTNADIGLSVTGVAGPDGGTTDKPVGLVWYAMDFKGIIISNKINVTGDRNLIRNRAAITIIDALRRELLKKEDNK